MESFLLPIALVHVPKQMKLWKVIKYQKWGKRKIISNLGF